MKSNNRIHRNYYYNNNNRGEQDFCTTLFPLYPSQKNNHMIGSFVCNQWHSAENRFFCQVARKEKAKKKTQRAGGCAS